MSLSDLEQARRLSRRLTQREGSAASRKGAGLFSPYLKLHQPSPPRPVETAGPRTIEAPPHFDGWESLIKWCLSQFRAEAGFAVDTQGFVIAVSGQIANDGFEGMGAELCYAMEQLDRVSPGSGGLHWVDLEFGRRRVASLRANPDGRDAMILGFVGADPDYIAIRAQVEHVVVDAMMDF